MKKFLLMALFCGFLMSTAIGCSGEPTKPTGPAKPVTPPATGATTPAK